MDQRTKKRLDNHCSSKMRQGMQNFGNGYTPYRVKFWVQISIIFTFFACGIGSNQSSVKEVHYPCNLIIAKVDKCLSYHGKMVDIKYKNQLFPRLLVASAKMAHNQMFREMFCAYLDTSNAKLIYITETIRFADCLFLGCVFDDNNVVFTYSLRLRKPYQDIFPRVKYNAENWNNSDVNIYQRGLQDIKDTLHHNCQERRSLSIIYLLKKIDGEWDIESNIPCKN